MLSEIAGAFVIIGVPLIAAAWFAGPARWATSTRSKLAPLMGAHPLGALGAVATVLVLIFIWGPIPATHRPLGIIVFTVLALTGTELLRRQIERESAAV
jgi:FtsH-binding integral membrane protein